MKLSMTRRLAEMFRTGSEQWRRTVRNNTESSTMSWGRRCWRSSTYDRTHRQRSLHPRASSCSVNKSQRSSDQQRRCHKPHSLASLCAEHCTTMCTGSRTRHRDSSTAPQSSFAPGTVRQRRRGDRAWRDQSKRAIANPGNKLVDTQFVSLRFSRVHTSWVHMLWSLIHNSKQTNKMLG